MLKAFSGINLNNNKNGNNRNSDSYDTIEAFHSFTHPVYQLKLNEMQQTF